MFYFFHDPHLVLDLLVKHTIFDKPPFFELFGGILTSIILIGNHIHRSEGTLPDFAFKAVLLRRLPSPHAAIRDNGRGAEQINLYCVVSEYASRGECGYCLTRPPGPGTIVLFTSTTVCCKYSVKFSSYASACRP